MPKYSICYICYISELATQCHAKTVWPIGTILGMIVGHDPNMDYVRVYSRLVRGRLGTIGRGPNISSNLPMALGSQRVLYITLARL